MTAIWKCWLPSIKMKVTFGDSTEELPNLMEANVDAVIEEALAKKESGDYTVQTDDLDDAVQVEVKALSLFVVVVVVYVPIFLKLSRA